MRAHEIAAKLEQFPHRGPGTDAERRAANWLADELRSAGREVRIDTFWCRPNWAAAQAWHVALAVAGSLISISHATIGGLILLAALLFVIADGLFGISPGRRLTVARASQNVVALPRALDGVSRRQGDDIDGTARRLRLIVTANYDAGRVGLVYRERIRAATASLKRATKGGTGGWQTWLCLAIVWLLVIAVLRHEGHHSNVVGVAQLIPTAALIIAGALLIEIATARYGPAANDNATGAAVSVALVRALDVSTPRNLSVELVLQGAGEAHGVGLRHHLRRGKRKRRRARPSSERTSSERTSSERTSSERTSRNAAVIAFAASGVGTLRYWTSDGSLLPLGYSPRFARLCAHLGVASPHKGRGATPAFPARLAGISAIALGCLDQSDIAPRSHRPDDHHSQLDEATLDGVVEFGLILVDALDASLSRRADAPTAAPA